MFLSNNFLLNRYRYTADRPEFKRKRREQFCGHATLFAVSIRRQSAHVSRTVLIALFLLAAALQLIRYLPDSAEVQLPGNPGAAATGRQIPAAENTALLFTPVKRKASPALLPAPSPPSQASDIAAPLSRYAPIKQRGHRDQAGSHFVKVSFEGHKLPPEETYWSCARDLESGLLWEVKLSNAGVSDAEHTYSWYDPARESPGKPDGGECFGVACDTHAYVQEMNRLALCGSRAWRLPSFKELDALIDRNYYDPTINQEYFPNK